MNLREMSVGDESLMEDRGLAILDVPADQVGGERLHLLCPVCGTRLRDVGRSEVQRGEVIVCSNKLCRQVVRLRLVGPVSR